MGQQMIRSSVTVRQASFKLSQLDEIYDTAHCLSLYFPQPEAVKPAIYELLFNAIEHGNLGIGYELKGELLRQGSLYEELTHRAALPENKHKLVHIEFEHENGVRCLSICDEGQGFDWRSYRLRAAGEFGAHGRGLLIIWQSPFHSVTFNNVGNSVVCEFID
jgi:hypothetical protein